MTGKVMDLLEAVGTDGAVVIEARKLRVLYGQTRMTRGIWRDLHDRWARLMEDDWEYEKAPELLIGQFDDQTVILAWGREWDPDKKEWEPLYLQPSTAFLKDDDE